MIQVLVKKGQALGEEVPAPLVSKGAVLIKVVYSCISAGTEMSSIQASGKPLIKRALEQPEKVKKVLKMLKSDGFAKTYKMVQGELETGKPTGYSLSGIIIGIGKGVENFEIGDRVAAAGGGFASHAEFVDVPINLVVKIPNSLELLSASTVALGSIAMQGVRRANLKLGEFAVVFGTGILGLLSLQMLKSSGVRVAAVDVDNKRLRLAKELGAEIVLNAKNDDIVKAVTQWSNGFGVDAVIFAAATSSDEPLSKSFQMCRRKGKVVLVGVSGMNIKRQDIYAKELDLQMATSYGPGRYDKNYEEKGIDYPYSYVRWTENRNMAEYLRLLAMGTIEVKKLTDNIFPIDKVSKAFDSLKDQENKPLLVFLDYGETDFSKLEYYAGHSRKLIVKHKPLNKNVINIGLIGTGSFATKTHLPNLEKLSNKYKLHAVMDRIGYKAKTIADLFNAKYATTNQDNILSDKDIDLVLICTRHDSHAELALQALKAGKHVFVEKPLATNKEELEKIKEFYQDGNDKTKPLLFVGFNRRFSKYSVEIKKHTAKRINPLFIHYRMNAGYIPPDHWVHENGGRIVGEGCHIIDLMSFLANSVIKSISSESLTPKTDVISRSDNKSIVLKYQDGSIAVIDYFAVGSKLFPKEYMEVHFDEKTIVMEDYRSLKGYGIKINEINTPTSEKGHFEELECLYQALSGNSSKWPIELWDIFQTTETTFLI